MLEAGYGANLACDCASGHVRLVLRLSENLHGDLKRFPRVDCAPNFSHSPFAQGTEEAKRTDMKWLLGGGHFLPLGRRTRMTYEILS